MIQYSFQSQRPPAILALADGNVLKGFGIGAAGISVGEMIFNTAMSGYQEILTDPSYSSQIVLMTYPHIGNVGVNPDDQESAKTWTAGLVVRDVPNLHSNWRSQGALTDYLCQHKVVAIAGIDTRHLTRVIRENGAQHVCLMSGDLNATAEQEAVARARAFAGLQGLDLARVVTTTKPYEWHEGTLQLPTVRHASTAAHQYRVVVYDFGVKRQILRLLVDAGCHVTVVPAQTSVEQVLAFQPHGVLLSNGPGDPAACEYAIAATKQLMKKGIPLFGICLGFQILALACGARTYKLKFGHHGSNHPVKNLQTQQVAVTSQNHGFAVAMDDLPAALLPTHQSLFDGTLQGFRHHTLPAFGFQGHPEASPGPHDLYGLFKDFTQFMAIFHQGGQTCQNV